MGNFVATEQVLGTIQQILEERLSKRSLELDGRGPENYPPITEWLISDYDFPDDDADRFPLGVIDLDEGGRTSERREQDTGETAEFDCLATVYIYVQSTKDNLRLMALRIGDAVMYALMREARGKRPKDQTVLPGWFRVWPTSMRYGRFEGSGLIGVEVRMHVIVDSSDTFSV